MNITIKQAGILVLTAFIFSGCAATCDKKSGDCVVKPSKKTYLFNGKDLSGWTFFLKDPTVSPEKVWSVKDGNIRCEGLPFGYMATTKYYSDYMLHVEWRWPENPTNSGIFLHIPAENNIWPMTVECQLKNGNAGDFVILGGAGVNESNVKKKNPSNEKQPGQWNSADIYCFGDNIIVYINGLLQNRATGSKRSSGRIALQSEGGPIEFRNVYVDCLPK